MKISIITVSFNSGKTIEQTILSVLNQTYTNIEYIIIDGKSTDNTQLILNKYRDKISRIVSERDNGLYDAINKGIDASTGDFIGILHSDDLYIDNNVIQKFVNLFIDSDCHAAYADLYYVDREDINRIKRKWKSGLHREHSFVYGWMPPHPTFFVKKEVYSHLGKYNTDFKTSADYELMLRFLFKHKVKTSYLPEYVLKMRVGGQSNASINNRIMANLEDRRAWQINNLRPKFFTLYLKPLRKIFQFRTNYF